MTDRTSKKGLGPGTLVHIGEKRTEKVNVRIIDYTHSSLREINLSDQSQCDEFVESDSVTWIDVDGIHDPSIIEGIGQKFNVHILVLEDIMNSESRPKVEFFDNYLFMTLKMIDFDKTSKHLNVEQFSLIIGKNYVITFQELPGDSFDSIRSRIRTSKGKVRTKDSYYLAYLLLDVIIDNYIAVSESYAEQIENLEANVLRKANEFTLHRILSLRKQLLDFKRSIDPLKEAINLIQKELDDNIAKYYRDLYDHIIYESENLVVYREMLVNLLDLYHSSLSFRMNNVMKVLTIITTIFVPLTFIVGVYGMNFASADPVTGASLPYNMPELYNPYGYPIVIGAMILIVAGMFIYFRRKKWL
ncbi:MAG: magnesium/cobalt transporter CorA [Crocinitomicaceae bacterium]|nr:magnesium/cobalt transporter CorA [Crocinitomicaceae bacterium]